MKRANQQRDGSGRQEVGGGFVPSQDVAGAHVPGKEHRDGHVCLEGIV
jgi:hypothetical protein